MVSDPVSLGASLTSIFVSGCLGAVALLLTVLGIWLAWLFYKEGEAANRAARDVLTDARVVIGGIKDDTSTTRTAAEEIRTRLVDLLLVSSAPSEARQMAREIRQATDGLTAAASGEGDEVRTEAERIGVLADSIDRTIDQGQRRAVLARAISDLSALDLSVLAAVHFLQPSESATLARIAETVDESQARVASAITRLSALELLQAQDEAITTNPALADDFDDAFNVATYPGMRFHEYCNSIRERLRRQ